MRQVPMGAGRGGGFDSELSEPGLQGSPVGGFEPI